MTFVTPWTGVEPLHEKYLDKSHKFVETLDPHCAICGVARRDFAATHPCPGNPLKPKENK